MLAPAVIGMGMTTPLIMHVAKEELKNIGRTIGIFYGLNIFGAAIGALISGLVLIETFGLTGSNYLAALLNIGIGCVALLLIRTENAFVAPKSETSGASYTARENLFAK